jgi:hypothetical protein
LVPKNLEHVKNELLFLLRCKIYNNPKGTQSKTIGVTRMDTCGLYVVNKILTTTIVLGI